MILNRIFNFVGYRFVNLALDFDNRHQYPKLEEARYKKEDPHEMKRVDYPLNEKSRVVDIGGLTGDFASRIYCRYSCYVDIYEPHPILCKIAEMNFEGNSNIIVYPFGLSMDIESGIIEEIRDNFIVEEPDTYYIQVACDNGGADGASATLTELDIIELG